jgi:hypothetical protein
MGVEASSAAEVQVEPRPWWESRLCLILVVLATTIPLLYPPIPPLVDLFGHMGRYRVELDIGQSAFLQRYYDYHWAPIGNLGVDMLVYPLGKLLGLEAAVKLIVLTIPPLTALGFLWVAREVHGRIPPTTFFAMPFIYSFPFLFGFANFALSVALAFLAFGLWLRLGRLERTKLRSWLFVPISIIVFFTHTYGWGLLGLLCFSADAVRLHDRGRSWFRAGFEAALHTSVMALPIFATLVWRGEARAHGATTLGWFRWELKWRWIYSALRDRWHNFDVASLVIVGMVVAYALFSRKLGFSRNLVFSCLVLLVVFVLMPYVVFSSAYADMRLMPYAMAVLVLAIRFKRELDLRIGGRLAVLGLAFFGARLAGNTASLAIAADDQRTKLEALDQLPRGVPVLSLFNNQCGRNWALPRNSHLGAMVIVRTEGFSNDQWVTPGMNLLALRYRQAGLFAADPTQMMRYPRCTGRVYRTFELALADFPRNAFQYVWMIDPPPLAPGNLTDLRLVWQRDGSYLYKVIPGA